MHVNVDALPGPAYQSPQPPLSRRWHIRKESSLLIELAGMSSLTPALIIIGP
jgi:hypothetical protein